MIGAINTTDHGILLAHNQSGLLPTTRIGPFAVCKSGRQKWSPKAPVVLRLFLSVSTCSVLLVRSFQAVTGTHRTHRAYTTSIALAS